jgi:acetylornithine aminotransferase
MNKEYLLPTYKRQPLTFVRGKGCWLYDGAGNAYLDALAGVGVNCLGHAHPALVAAIQHQAETLIHVSNIYHIADQETLGEKLCHLTGMDKVFFNNSGAEANETAIKLARIYGHGKGVGNPAIIVMDGAFHGRTLATLSATANHKVQAGFEPLVTGFVRVPYNDANAVAHAADQDASVVAVLVEPVQGEGGVNAPDNGYLAALREICDARDLLLMLDEVQTGNGRTGSYFAFQKEGIIPDVLTTAKGLGGGFPIGACLTHGAATPLFGPGNHGSTFGGNPLGCAAALAVIDELQILLPTINQRANLLCSKLERALAPFPMVKEIRHRGLMIGIPFDRECTRMVDLAREQQLLINVTAGSVVRLLPPLIINESEIDTLCERLVAAVTLFANSQDAA